VLVEFIIPTYDRIDTLKSMLCSLIAQTLNEWGAMVMIDREFYQQYEDMLKSFNDSRIVWAYMDKRHNDFGHTPRQVGKQASTADYIIMTGDDNYYMPTFVNELKKASINKPGIIYYDMVHSHYDYSYFECQLGYNHIDMGAFATRRDIAQSINLNTSYAADGEFIEDYKRLYPNELNVKISKVLFVHN
jgi:hypothetical protein